MKKWERKSRQPSGKGERGGRASGNNGDNEIKIVEFIALEFPSP